MGLNGTSVTLREIARRLNLTVEEVITREAKALSKLKSPAAVAVARKHFPRREDIDPQSPEGKLLRGLGLL